MRFDALVTIGFIWLSCSLLGCSSTPKYGVGTRGELRPFETPEELIPLIQQVVFRGLYSGCPSSIG